LSYHANADFAMIVVVKWMNCAVNCEGASIPVQHSDQGLSDSSLKRVIVDRTLRRWIEF